MKSSHLVSSQASAALLACASLIVSLGAMAADVVPELPPIPDAVDAQPPSDNFLWKNYWDPSHSPRKPQIPPLTDVVTSENPLKVDPASRRCWPSTGLRGSDFWLVGHPASSCTC